MKNDTPRTNASHHKETEGFAMLQPLLIIMNPRSGTRQGPRMLAELVSFSLDYESNDAPSEKVFLDIKVVAPTQELCGQVTDLMFSGSLYVSEMLDLGVSHDLLVLPGTCKEDIREVVSHPQALGQCAEYIRKSGWEAREFANTARATSWYSICTVACPP